MHTHMQKCTHRCRSAQMDVQKHTGGGLKKPSESRTSLHEETLLSDLLISYWRDGSGLTLLLFSLTLTTILPLFLREGTTCLAYILQCSPVVFMFSLKYCSACNSLHYNVWAKCLLQKYLSVLRNKCISDGRFIIQVPQQWCLIYHQFSHLISPLAGS